MRSDHALTPTLQWTEHTGSGKVRAGPPLWGHRLSANSALPGAVPEMPCAARDWEATERETDTSWQQGGVKDDTGSAAWTPQTRG